MIITAFIVLFPLINGECCVAKPHGRCADCSNVSTFSCCGESKCNIFCCNCNKCREIDLCKEHCSVATPFRLKRSIDDRLIEDNLSLPDNAVDIVKLLDTTNNNGKIELNEMINWFQKATTRISNTSAEFIAAEFAKIDIDNDNHLTIDEIDPQYPRKSNRITRNVVVLHSKSYKESSLHSKNTINILRSVSGVNDKPEITTRVVFKPNKDITDHASISIHKQSAKTCGITVEITSSTGTTTSQMVPKAKDFLCSTSDLDVFTISLLPDTETLHESLVYDGKNHIQKIKFIYPGLTPLLLTDLCVTLRNTIIPSTNSAVICVSPKFLKACINKKKNPRLDFKQILQDDKIKLWGTFPGFDTIIIDNIAKFITEMSNVRFDMPITESEEVLDEICKLVFVTKSPKRCPNVENGCSCNGLVLPEKCNSDVYTLKHFLLGFRNVHKCSKFKM